MVLWNRLRHPRAVARADLAAAGFAHINHYEAGPAPLPLPQALVLILLGSTACWAGLWKLATLLQ